MPLNRELGLVLSSKIIRAINMVLIMVKILYLHNLALNMVILLPILGVNFDNKLGTDVLFEVLDAKVDRQRQLLQEPKILHQV